MIPGEGQVQKGEKQTKVRVRKLTGCVVTEGCDAAARHVGHSHHTGCLYSRMSTLIPFHLRTCCMIARIITRAHLGEIRLCSLVQADFDDHHVQTAYCRPPSSFWPNAVESPAGRMHEHLFFF